MNGTAYTTDSHHGNRRNWRLSQCTAQHELKRYTTHGSKDPAKPPTCLKKVISDNVMTEFPPNANVFQSNPGVKIP